MLIKKIKLSNTDYNRYFDTLEKIKKSFDVHNTMKIEHGSVDIFSKNLKLLKKVNSAYSKLNQIKKGDAFTFEKKNYIAKDVYFGYDKYSQHIYIQEIRTICENHIIGSGALRRIKVLK